MSTEVEQAVVVDATEAVATANEAEVSLVSSDAPVVSEVAVNGTESPAQPMPEASQETTQEAQPEASQETNQEAQPQAQPEATPQAQPQANQDQGAKRKRRRRRRGGRRGRPLDAFNPGDELEGVVRSVQPYGAFIDVGAERDGLIHISELRDGFVEKVEDVIKEGDKVTIRVKEVQVEQGRLSLTMRNPDSEKGSREPKKKRLRLKELEEEQELTGTVSSIVDFGAFVDIGAVTDGLVHISEISEDRVNNVSDHLQEGQEIKVRILAVDKKRKRISLTMREKQAIEEKYMRTSGEDNSASDDNSNRYNNRNDNRYSNRNRNGNGNGNGNRNRGKRNSNNDFQIDTDTDELPSMMQLAFARAQARKKKSSKKTPQDSDNTLDDIITRMLAE